MVFVRVRLPEARAGLASQTGERSELIRRLRGRTVAACDIAELAGLSHVRAEDCQGCLKIQPLAV